MMMRSQPQKDKYGLVDKCEHTLVKRDHLEAPSEPGFKWCRL